MNSPTWNESLIEQRLCDTAGLRRALRFGVLHALREHALHGRQVPVWQNDRVEWVLPDLDELNAELASLKEERGAASEETGG